MKYETVSGVVTAASAKTKGIKFADWFNLDKGVQTDLGLPAKGDIVELECNPGTRFYVSWKKIGESASKKTETSPHYAQPQKQIVDSPHVSDVSLLEKALRDADAMLKSFPDGYVSSDERTRLAITLFLQRVRK